MVPRVLAAALGLTGVLVDLPAAAQGVGDAPSALPGLSHVGVPVFRAPRVAAALGLGYGFTEALSANDGAHHRALAIAAVSATVLDGLSFGLRSDVRYDRHPGGDDGWIADPSLVLRAGRALGTTHVGLEAGARFSGAEGFSTTLQSVSPLGVVQLAWIAGALTFATQGGYRLDRSGRAGRNAARLSFGDRVALGLSDFDAVLAGLGIAYHIGATEILAELSGDVLVGSGAPRFTESPLRAAAGVRHHASETVQLGLLVEGSLSSRPGALPSDPLVPIEPRVVVLAGVGLSFDLAPQAAPPPPPPPKPVVPPRPTSTRVTITLTDDEHKPIPDAKATLKSAGGTRNGQSDTDGNVTFDDVPRGHATVTVERNGYDPITRDVEVDPSHPVAIDLGMTARPQGQVRGLIRAFSGAGVAAKVRVEPLGVEAKADAQGYFELDVPPGKYEVVIEAPGYSTQRRNVEVQKDGVVVLNADLYKR